MTRIIDAEKLKKHYAWWEDDERRALFDQIVDAQPTIDAEPVRHGKWIEYPTADGMNQCSLCGVLRFGESNYCPNCGKAVKR